MGESFVSFLFCSATDPRVSGTQNFNKRAVSFSSGSQEGEDGSVRDLVSTLPSPSLFASGQQGPVRGRDAFSRIPCPTMEPGQCHTTHSDPTSRRTAFRVGPLCSISLPHRGYVSDSPGPACTVPGGLARAPQAVSLAPEDYQTRLRDSVRPASPQVQPLLHRTQERRWVTTNPGPTRSEPGPSQAPVQDVDAETHLSMRPSLRLVCSNRPEGRLLPCLDPPSTQTVSPLCVRGASIPVQGPSLRAIPVTSCLHQGRRSSPCTVKGSRHSYPQLPRRLAHSGPVSSTVVRTQGYGAQSPQPVGTSGQPGKEQLSPTQRISFLGMELDSVNLTARLSEERAQSMLRCLESLQRKRAVPLKHFQRLLGHMASSAAITPLGLLHMRPLQRWLHDRVPRWAWRHGTYRVSLTPSCRRTFSPWSDLAFLRAGVPLEQVSRHVVVSTDASATGWGAMCNGHAAAGLWTGPQLQWHINCLELLAVWLALRRFRTLLHEKHILVRSDNTAIVAYINHQGGLRSRRMSQLSRHLLLWSQKHLRSLRAVHVPGELNRAADEFSRQHALPGEWRLHPKVLQLIWRHFGDAQVDLFASPDTSHCQLFFSLSKGTLGTDALACSWPRCLRKYAFPPVSLLAQTLCKVREDEEQVLLVAPYWPNRTWFPELMLLATAPPWQIPLRRDLLSQRGGTLWHPRPDLWNLHVWSLERDAEVLSGLPPAVVNTITSARALSTRQAYRLKWNLFVNWCSPRREDPRRCPIAVVLFFLQDGLERRLSPSTLKVYVAAIAAHHDAVDGKSLGKHDLVIRFLRGARRLNPPRPHLVPSWDLPSVLSTLRGAPFEPLQSVELKFLSLKTVLLSALATVKRVGDLQAFSVNDSCLEFGPADSHVVLRPRPGYVPKVPTMPFRDQVVNLQALPREEADPAIALLCPVRALHIYVDRTQSFRTSDQLFVCFGGQQKGRAVSKQRLAHWIVEAIVLAYQARRLPCPLGVRAHSTRGVASSWALARGASIADICKAAGWATPNTFARFYNLRIEPVSSRVLVSDGQ